MAMFRISNPRPRSLPRWWVTATSTPSPTAAPPATSLRSTASAAPGRGGADINTWWNTHTSEQWQFARNTDGTVRIFDNCNTSTQVNGTLTETSGAGGPVTVSTAYTPGDVYQEWVVTENSSTGVITITNKGTGYVLDTTGTATGSTVVTNSPTTSATQGWVAMD
ncbi:ricin-type beta-trefoil lectin domain protein [Streptacidiphilus sp. 4-A2]|nr:ricin-type beta-trefoil lectin domain protein [Streptacidiphilus sp. 4-A2]